MRIGRKDGEFCRYTMCMTQRMINGERTEHTIQNENKNNIKSRRKWKIKMNVRINTLTI